MLASVVTIACQVCALADYFYPPNNDRPTLTIGEPCPGGTREVERNGEVITCEQDAERSLRVSFDEEGRVESYVTLIDGERNGVSQRWHANGKLAEEARWNGDQLHGTRRLYDENRVLVLEESWIRNTREGSYKRKVDARGTEYGRYKAGEREGNWHEWHDGRFAVGTYRAGRRIGRWNLMFDDDTKTVPDYVVHFADDGTPLDASETTKKYGEVMLLADGAMIALGVWGHYSERPELELAGGAGLLAAGPIVHALYQPSGQRWSKVRESTVVRLGAPVAVFALYSVGKFFAAFDCEKTEYDPSTGDSCTDYSFDYNTKYNVDAIKLATAIVIAAGDYATAYRSQKTTVREAWPTLGVMPTNGGAEVSLAGRF